MWGKSLVNNAFGSTADRGKDDGGGGGGVHSNKCAKNVQTA